MNGTSGFQEVRSFTSRLPSYRLLHEQQPQVGTGSWHLVRTHDFTARSTSRFLFLVQMVSLVDTSK